ncbi:hypothetical protein CI109_100263 [Kwoniella shandongensis]|uniref:Uncharacterized protein n=1 Tax=Kwoniella shandongensis TaxID=1734106 RepID=A0A5M6C836_9TREE|nr:uncharacterized protein CI109_001892 [Kwoniella shandongensis]KAA5529952.1 hypothetical protein CI109_001892 [Kwoniella shandongensis]
MAAPFTAPSTSNPPTEIPDITGASSSSTSSVVPPKPVTPAEAIPVAPASALDPIAGEPTILDKAKDLAKPYLDKAEPYLAKAQETTKPYVDKVQEATKPYTDKAAAKAQEIIDKIEGNAPSTSATPTSAGTVEKSVDNASATAAETGEKAKGLFEQGLSAVQSTFTQITHTIDEKTASPTHPGLITQVTNAVHKGVEKAEHFLNEAADSNTVPGQPINAAVPITGDIPIVPSRAL